MPGKQWTEHEMKLVSRLACEGWNNKEIAGALNRTPQAVANKKISIRDPEYYIRAQARSDSGREEEIIRASRVHPTSMAGMPTTFKENKMKRFDWEAAGILVAGLVVFSVLAWGSVIQSGTGL
jgi:IS30 family transposase